MEETKEARIINRITCIMLVLNFMASVFFSGIDVLNDMHVWKKEEDEIQKVESGFHPNFESRKAEKIPIGEQDYYKFYLQNDNENVDIVSGTFGFEYIVILKAENSVQEVFSWEGMIAQPKVVYDKKYKGCFLFIREDYSDCEKQIQKICEKSEVEISECCSYVFFAFEYVCNGQNKEVYYLLELNEERCNGTVEVMKPDEYRENFRMSL